MSPEIKLALLFAGLFLLAIFVTILIVMQSLGTISNHLGRLQDILSKELVLRYNMKVNELRQERQRDLSAMDRVRRQEALLQIPLNRSSTRGAKG